MKIATGCLGDAFLFNQAPVPAEKYPQERAVVRAFSLSRLPEQFCYLGSYSSQAGSGANRMGQSADDREFPARSAAHVFLFANDLAHS